jgi:hypothetical protein
MDGKRGAYKPLRNLARRFALAPALSDLWAIQRHVATGAPLPQGFEPLPGQRQGTQIAHVFPQFKIDQVARELLLHGVVPGNGDRTLRRSNHVADLFNAIRDYGSETTAAVGNDNIFAMLHRIGHQQVPMFGSMNRHMNRSQMVYGHPAMRDVFFEQTGLSMVQFLRMSLLVLQQAIASPYWSRRQSYLTDGIPDAAADAFFARMSAGIDEHRATLLKNQVLDVGWEFTPNSLQARPLIKCDTSGMNFCCPIVPHLVQRLFSGIYYDLVSHPHFSRPFGEAVDSLVGMTLRRGYPACLLLKPDMYRLAGEEFRGADWIASDSTANIFVECKAKRPRMATKTLLNEEDLDEDIDTLARAIVQNYQNIDHAIRSLTSWAPNGLPTFSVIVTLEDWVLFSPFAREPLHNRVLHHMTRKGLNRELIDQVPYFVASAADIEELACAAVQYGLEPILTAKRSGEQASWMFRPFFQEFYPDARRLSEHLFDEDISGMLREAERLKSEV